MKEDGVSGVVGVILLMALVIIAASLVAAVAFGVSDSTEPVPNITADVHFSGSGDAIVMTIEHMSGDFVSCADVKVTTFVTLEDGSQHGGSFMLDTLAKDPVWSAGNLLKTSGTAQTAKCLGISSDELKNAFSRSTPVLIKIYHLPSSGVLYQDTILMEKKT